ncbi:hypothetical protein F4778DRAFT_784025 [Xylariomycetidae sp. FL2044]|nr:hypothetical protein F4778DRAFT_784025 [Xylariomycetidae sp. FL2044]
MTFNGKNGSSTRFEGYGMDMPDLEWPGGAKVCVSFVVHYNMGAELSVLNGDELSCNALFEIPRQPAIKGAQRKPGAGQEEYGGREGVSRLLKMMFKKNNVLVAWNIHTRAIERNPYWVKPILESGAELRLGRYRWRDNLYVDPKDEDMSIENIIHILQSITGDKPLPSGSIIHRSSPSLNVSPCWLVEPRSNLTTKLYCLAHASRQLPLVYSSDSCQDDLPYWRPSPTGEEGPIGRTICLEEFIKYTQSKGACIARRVDMAKHWQSKFPYDPKKAFGQTKVPNYSAIRPAQSGGAAVLHLDDDDDDDAQDLIRVIVDMRARIPI